MPNCGITAHTPPPLARLAARDLRQRLSTRHHWPIFTYHQQRLSSVYTLPILAGTQFKEPTMQLNLRQTLQGLFALVLVILFLIPTDLVAQNHVVSRADLQKEVAAASQSRQQNLKTVQEF